MVRFLLTHPLMPCPGKIIKSHCPRSCCTCCRRLPKENVWSLQRSSRTYLVGLVFPPRPQRTTIVQPGQTEI